MSMAMALGKPGVNKLNAVGRSQIWLSVHRDHLETKLATPLQLLVLYAQVRNYEKSINNAYILCIFISLTTFNALKTSSI